MIKLTMSEIVIVIAVAVTISVIAILWMLFVPKLPKIILNLDFRKNGVTNIREFVSDGPNIWFTDSMNNSIICFRKSDGSFVRKLTNELQLFFIEWDT
jgi:hypothetical protein